MWKERVAKAAALKLNCKVLAGFNSVIDAVIKLDKETIERLGKQEPNILLDHPKNPTQVWPLTSKVEFIALLKECVKGGKSFYGVMDSKLADWFDSVFPKREEAMGGQAGIVANQMAALGASSNVYTPVLSAKQAAIFDQRVRYPVIDNGVTWVPIRKAVNDNWTKVNYIFEYPKGMEFVFGDQVIRTPRANRIILGTRNPKAAMGFDQEIQPYLGQIGHSLDLAFMAGYHHGKIEGRTNNLQEYIDLSKRDLLELKSQNYGLKLHLEYVPMKNSQDEIKLLNSLMPVFTSFGINENEICRLLDELGYAGLVDEITNNERAYSLYKGALAIMRTFRVPRIHLHNLGYYVVILAKPYYVNPDLVHQACMFASVVNQVKARQGGAVSLTDVAHMADSPLSDIGLQQLRLFADEAMQSGIQAAPKVIDTGIMEMDDHYALIVPAHIESQPLSTVGMGDTVSSCAYAAEVSLAKLH